MNLIITIKKRRIKFIRIIRVAKVGLLIYVTCDDFIRVEAAHFMS